MPSYQVLKLDSLDTQIGSCSPAFALMRNNRFDVETVPTLFLAYQSLEKGLDEDTVGQDASFLRIFFETIDRADDVKHWDKITKQQMSAYLNQYLAQGNRVRRTIQQHAKTIRAFYNWAYEYGYMSEPLGFNITVYGENATTEDVVVDAALNKSNIIQTLDNEEFELLLSGFNSSDDYCNERDELMMRVGKELGLRTSEVRGLRVSELEMLANEFKNKKAVWLRIDGKYTKLRKSRLLLIKIDLYKRITRFLNGKRKRKKQDLLSRGKNVSDALFITNNGNAVAKSAATKAFYKASNNVGLRDGLSFHDLRHTFATELAEWLLSKGLDIKILVADRLGHEDYKMSSKYIHKVSKMIGWDMQKNIIEDVEPDASVVNMIEDLGVAYG